MNKIVRSKFFWLGLIFICIIGFGIYINTNWMFFGPEETVQFGEAFMCRGPDENGNPTEAVEKFSRTDWEEIYLCVYAVPDVQATLDAYWIYNKDGRAFAFGSLIRIYESQYLYFPFQEAVEAGNKTYYFQQELQNRDFPPGEYSVLIKQIRAKVLTVNFEITN